MSVVSRMGSVFVAAELLESEPVESESAEFAVASVAAVSAMVAGSGVGRVVSDVVVWVRLCASFRASVISKEMPVSWL